LYFQQWHFSDPLQSLILLCCGIGMAGIILQSVFLLGKQEESYLLWLQPFGVKMHPLPKNWTIYTFCGTSGNFPINWYFQFIDIFLFWQ